MKIKTVYIKFRTLRRPLIAKSNLFLFTQLVVLMELTWGFLSTQNWDRNPLSKQLKLLVTNIKPMYTFHNIGTYYKY